MKSIITLILLYLSLIVGVILALALEKWFFIGLVVVYIPLYLFDRQYNPTWPKNILNIFRTKHIVE